MDEEKKIRYTSPDISSLRESGYYPIDMHLHTIHSDGLTRIPDLIRYAEKKRIGCAITDHNEISGVLEAFSYHPNILLIPGIELETLEGPHLLIYFYTVDDLEEFFKKFTSERNRKKPGFPQNLSVLECLMLAESFDCLRVAAHPFGYYGINRGVLKCVEKKMLPDVMDHLDGIEVICGGMIDRLNKKAISYAENNVIPFTGGSDAHILPDIGSVITGVPADNTDDFLNGIIQRKNVVVGKPGCYLHKGATAGVIAWSFIPYGISWMNSHYSFHKSRTSRVISKYRGRIPIFRDRYSNKKCESEKGRK